MYNNYSDVVIQYTQKNNGDVVLDLTQLFYHILKRGILTPPSGNIDDDDVCYAQEDIQEISLRLIEDLGIVPVVVRFMDKFTCTRGHQNPPISGSCLELILELPKNWARHFTTTSTIKFEGRNCG
jgi:hypothetical protein